ncbi:MAG: hypothetical protein ACYTG3_08100 [Planctomycetota bacterium]
MNPTKLCVLAALAALIVFGQIPARAQDEPAETPKPPSKTEMEKEQDKAMAKMDAWMKATVEFSKDTRLTETDVKKWIELAPSFDKIGEGEKENEDIFEKCFKDGKFSFDYILQHAAYGKWAREHGVDTTQWLKKHMRVSMLIMREEGLKHIEKAEKELPQQLKQIEAMKGQMDENMYKQMKKAVEASVAAMAKTKKLYLSIPKPTEDEAKLLKTYGPQLRRAMGDGEEDDGGCGEFGEDEDYEMGDED